MSTQDSRGRQPAVRRSIRRRLLLLLLSLTTVSVLIVGYLAVNSIRRFGASARRTSAGALRDQAEESLRQLAVGEARRIDLKLDAVRQDTQRVAQYAARVFSDPGAFADRAYWQAQDRMFVGSSGQYKNAETDVSSAFVPDFVEVDEEILNTLELGAYLDFVFVPTYEGNEDAVAIYLGTEHETTQYHPNIDLGAVVPPDFQVTQRPWYVAAAPEENPDKRPVWSPVYLDATGRGLLVTASSPVYSRGDVFVGAVGIDVTLGSIAASVEEARVLGGGYAFLLDGEGRAIALPEQGYRDVLGRAPDADEVWPDLTGTSTPFDSVLAEMVEGSSGFAVMEVGGRDLFVAYAPLQTAGWSLGTVAEEQAVLQAMAPLETDLEASTRSLVLTRILPAGAGILLAMAALGLLLARRLTEPIQKMAAAAQRIGAGEWDAPLPETGDDEIGVLARAFDQMTRQLQDLYTSLEQRVSQRTAELERRAVELEAAAEVARDAATVRAKEQLLRETVHLISEKFGFYHAGIFLLDEAGRYAVLEAASSEGGQRMLARGHKLEVGRVGIVGYVADSGEPRIALDVGEDAVFFENPDLPDTRSEMALPLKVRDEVVGVLDAQSVEGGAFSDEDVGVLQTLADQLAVAIENARLLEESHRALRELERLYGERATEAWREQAAQRATYRYTGVDVEPVSPLDRTELEGLGRDGEWGAARDLGHDGRRLAAPLRLRGQDIGSIVLQRDPNEEPWSPEDATLVEEVSGQVALALESARLFEEARVRAHEQSVLSELGRALTAQLSVDEILLEAYERASDLIDARNFYVGLYDPGREEIVIRFGANSPQAERGITVVSADEGLSGYVLRTRRPVLLPGNVTDWLAEHGIEPIGQPALSWLGVPLTVGEEVLGLMAVESYSADSTFDEHDLDLLITVASQTAIALQSARLFEEAVQTADRLREVDRLKSQFLANMSHELRTPLNSIIGFSRVVLKGIDGPITDRQREDLEAIHSSGQHLLGLINDILDVSKIEAGKMELGFEKIDLSEIIAGVMSTAVALVKDKPIELQRSIADNLPEITADERRVRQILLNLVSNAAKFTEEGFVRVEARVEDDDVILSVADSGVGIDEAQRETIFEPFTQMDASTTREQGGTGLGLTISRSFAELHGGRIWVESTPGEGSTFYLALPIEGPSSETEGPEVVEFAKGAPGSELPGGVGSGELVLCVDDDSAVISLYHRYLNSRGYRVFGLTDSTRVIEFVQRLQPYAITLDLVMPQKDGWQVLEELKADPATSDVPVIICSVVSEVERAVSLGAADYLVKPIVEADMVAALDRLGPAAGAQQRARQPDDIAEG